MQELDTTQAVKQLKELVTILSGEARKRTFLMIVREITSSHISYGFNELRVALRGAATPIGMIWDSKVQEARKHITAQLRDHTDARLKARAEPRVLSRRCKT